MLNSQLRTHASCIQVGKAAPPSISQASVLEAGSFDEESSRLLWPDGEDDRYAMNGAHHLANTADAAMLLTCRRLGRRKVLLE